PPLPVPRRQQREMLQRYASLDPQLPAGERAGHAEQQQAHYGVTGEDAERCRGIGIDCQVLHDQRPGGPLRQRPVAEPLWLALPATRVVVAGLVAAWPGGRPLANAPHRYVFVTVHDRPLLAGLLTMCEARAGSHGWTGLLRVMRRPSI